MSHPSSISVLSYSWVITWLSWCGRLLTNVTWQEKRHICHVPAAATISTIVVTPTQRRPQHHHIIWSFHVMSLLLLPHTTQSKQFSWMKYLQKALHVHDMCFFSCCFANCWHKLKFHFFYISSYYHDPSSLYPVASYCRIALLQAMPSFMLF